MKTLKLEVGKTYRSRRGGGVRIARKGNTGSYPYQGNDLQSYTESGRFYLGKESEYDLIEEIPSEPTRHTFAIPYGATKLTVEQVSNRIIVEMVPEVKEPKPGDVRFKEGDIVFEDGRIMIVKAHPNLYHAMFYVGFGNLHIDREYGVPFTSAAFRLATAEEEQLLFDALKKAGKRWNAETMQVEEIPEIERILEWVEENIKDGYYNHEDVAEAIEGYLKHKEDKQ